MNDKTKICKKCGLTKAKSDFYKSDNYSLRRYKDGIYPVCKVCCRERSRKESKKESYKEKARKRSAKQRAKNREEFNLAVRFSDYKRWGIKITKEEYLRLKEASGGCCAICGVNVTSMGQSLYLDHCHKTGKVRGFLCITHNFMLGKFKDDPTRLISAINYLKRYE